jgi:hypothetical protein
MPSQFGYTPAGGSGQTARFSAGERCANRLRAIEMHNR